MFILDNLASFDWCRDGSGIIKAMSFIKAILNIIRILVPIGLVGYTIFEVVKKVINPDDKDGQKKIMLRIIAALVVFLTPTIIRLSFRVIDWSRNVNGTYENAESGLSSCWR